jgi:hypothetical protein
MNPLPDHGYLERHPLATATATGHVCDKPAIGSPGYRILIAKSIFQVSPIAINPERGELHNTVE